MKFITTKSIDPSDFKRRPFVFYNSVKSIVNNQANANNFYILEVEEEEKLLLEGQRKTTKERPYYYQK